MSQRAFDTRPVAAPRAGFTSGHATEHSRPAQVRGAERRFAVYRDNVATGVFSALSARYPVVKRLVGDEFFREMSRQYATAEPPRSPVMRPYGETFPAFIVAFEPARPIPYLAAVASIEKARDFAHHAAEVQPLGPDAFAALAPGELAGTRVTLHPSVSIVSSPYPVYSIWKVNQARAPVVPVSPWAAEAVLIARPSYAAEVHKLAPGQDAFLHVLSEGSTVAAAVAAGQQIAASFDAVQGLAFLTAAGIVTRLGWTGPAIRAGEFAH